MCSKLEKFVQYKGEAFTMLKQLKDEKVFAGHEGGEKALEEMELLFNYLSAMGVLNKI